MKVDLPERIALATLNVGKAAELRSLLSSIGREGYTVATFASPEEDGETYEDNAIKKAACLAKTSGAVALGDDSGLEVMALGGAPGLKTRRWASEGFEAGMRLLHDTLSSQEDKCDGRATMVTSLALVWPDGKSLAATGRLSGSVVWPPRGRNRIGYEPMFQPIGSERTLDEFERAERARTDARARAFAELIERINFPE